MTLLKRLGSAVALVAGLYLVNLFAPQWLGGYYLQILIYCGVYIMLAVSLNVITGLAGQFSLGHAAFMGIGAYCSAAITFLAGRQLLAAFAFLGEPGSQVAVFLIALAAAAGGAALAGLLVGLPALRLRGDYLAVATLGFGEIIRLVISQVEAVGAQRGFSAPAGLPQFSNLFWVYLWVVITLVIARNLAQSAHGRALCAIRDDELAAASVGINTTRYKVAAFVIGASLAGVAGCLLAHFMMYLHPDLYGFIPSVEIVVMVVVGGMGSLTGSVAAAVLLTVLPEALRSVTQEQQQLRMVIYAAGLVALMLVRPAGLLGSKELSGRLLRRLWRKDVPDIP